MNGALPPLFQPVMYDMYIKYVMLYNVITINKLTGFEMLFLTIQLGNWIRTNKIYYIVYLTISV